MNQLDMSGRCAIVTGGAAGIGFAIARRLAASGAELALWDRDARALSDAANAIGGKVSTVEVDVTDESQVAGAVASAITKMGRIDALVCSAGITGPNMPVRDYSLADWQQVLDINLTGVFLCNKLVIAQMVRHDYGRIVNIASIAGKEGNPGAPAYGSMKAGVIALTKSLGKELAKYDIGVNCVTPSVAATKSALAQDPEFVKMILSKVPRGRMLELTEAASMICWLASRENSFTTAAVFDLSGGRATY